MFVLYSFYSKLESLGINKIKIGNLVRYRKDEIEDQFLARMNISVFEYLKDVYNNDYIDVIQNRALDLLEPKKNMALFLSFLQLKKKIE